MVWTISKGFGPRNAGFQLYPVCEMEKEENVHIVEVVVT
jgi:hypothetical protein